MKHLVVLITAAAMLAACGGRPVRQINVLHEAHNAMSQDALTVDIGAQKGSRQWGSAGLGDAKRGRLGHRRHQARPLLGRSRRTSARARFLRQFPNLAGARSSSRLPA
ncbi:MAG TPA: hypothetical protein VFN37_06165 [Candidatus Baltobacteraceae bacterium]|nr:hypothetical protein [Candidatus Baltobacteraceae bacterium]